MVIRGHQYKCSINTGHCSDFGGALLTVFSSSNYCGTESNNTGYVHVKGPECRVQAHTLRTAQEAAKYRQFNVLKMLVDERTKAVTYVAFWGGASLALFQSLFEADMSIVKLYNL